MVDTQRSITAVKALLADNTTGDISPQDVRDMLETLRSGHGEISVTSAAATSFADASSFVDIAGTWALSANNHNWDMNSNGQLRYTGTADRICHIACSFSFTSSTNNQVIEWTVAKNGTAITQSVLENKIGTGSDVQSSALHAFATVSTNDYLTIQCKNTTWSGAQTVTSTTANLFAMSMPV